MPMVMDTLLSDIEAFCERHGMSRTEFGKQAMNDRPFVNQLADGRNITFATVKRCRNFMADFERGEAA